MNILIIEDELPAARQLTKMLRQADPAVNVLATLDSVEASVAWLSQPVTPPDAIFMDIQIADGLSFDIFQQVKITAPVVFTTAFNQYAVKAFRVNAVDYLLKPIDPDELNEVMRKLKAKATPILNEALMQQLIGQLAPPTRQVKDRFLVRGGQQLYTIEATQIAWFISEEGETMLNTYEGQRYFYESTLDQLESALDPARFFRIRRNLIVSLDAIARISPHFNGRLKIDLKPAYAEEVFVSRERVSDFKAWLGG